MKALSNQPNKGLALIAVLWLVAAMGLIITGVVKSVRTETISSGQQRQTLQAQVRADAILVLALQNLFGQVPQARKSLQVGNFNFDGQELTVKVSSLNGLVDINNAPPILLAELYKVAGGLDTNAAQSLAQATVEVRNIQNAKGLRPGFDAPEDLFRVPGMTYDRYAMIRGLVTADLKDGSGRVNPMAAPLPVLGVLAGGDLAKAAAFAANRGSGQVGMDGTFFRPDFIENNVSSSTRLQTTTPLPGGGFMTRIWDIYGTPDPRTGLPWRILGKSSTFSQTAPADN
jgi:general secretion pathway protein K